jgi:hypothetical protein
MSAVAPSPLRLDEVHLGAAVQALNHQQRLSCYARVFVGLTQKTTAEVAGNSTSSGDVLKSTGSWIMQAYVSGMFSKSYGLP